MRSDLHILIPAYGPSPYLAETLDSVLTAADVNTLVTVLDDGSPGREIETVAAAFGQRLQLVRVPDNRGVAASFQACAEMSRGDYTVIMGSDDILEPWYVHEVRSLVEEFRAPAMVLPAVSVIDGEGATVRPLADRVKGWLAPSGDRPMLLSGESLATRLLWGNWLYFPAIAWRTDLLRTYGFRQDLATVLDLDLELRLVFAGEGLAWSPRASFRYRRHSGSASSVAAAVGDRFREEDAVHFWSAATADSLHWRRASRAARLHPTSRLHAGLARIGGVRRAAMAMARRA